MTDIPQGLPLPAYTQSIVESPEEKRRRELIEQQAAPLGFLRRLYYRFMLFFMLGNVAKMRRALLLHKKAVDLSRIERQLAKELWPEAKLYMKMLRDGLSYLGYAYLIVEQGNKRFKQTIRFQPPVKMSAEMIAIRVRSRDFNMWGSKNALPYRVKLTDITDDDTLRHLSMTLNREVTTRWEPHKGLWYIVWRLRDSSGLPKLVRFSDMLEFYRPGQAELCLGVSDNRKVEINRMGRVPHVLLAGETGGGKSNTLNNWLCGLIRFNTPQQVKLFLVDLKGGLELSDYEDIPHLAGPIIIEHEPALLMLRQALALCKARHKIIRSRKGAKSIDQLNVRLPEEKRLPRLIIVIDELAELLIGGAETRDAIELMLLRIAALGRASGVHLICATQRPSKEIVSTNISHNMPLRVSHKMSRPSDSITILGTGDAAELPDIPGRAVYKIGWEVIRVQPPYVTFPDIMQSVAIAQEMPGYKLRLPHVDAPASQGIALLVPDDRAALIKLLETTGPSLAINAIRDVIGLSQSDAMTWRQGLEGFEFEHNSQHYTIRPYGRGFRITENGHNAIRELPRYNVNKDKADD